MKASELREMSIPDLNKELISLLKTHFGLRMQLATQQLSNPNQLKIIRRDVARVRTVITQKSNKYD